MVQRKKAYVLGGKTGLLGSALVDTLIAAGWDVASSGGSAEINFSASDAMKKIEHILDEHEPDVVFNTVAYTKVDNAEDNPTEASMLNRNLPCILARLSKEKGFKLVHYSTDFVFDGTGECPYSVEDATNPQSVYGKTKLEGEEAILSLNLSNALIIRTAWLFGPGKRNFVTAIIDKCKAGEALTVVDDQVGSPTYTIDLATNSLRLVEANAHGIYHVVNSGKASWFDLAVESINLAGLECSINAVSSSAWPQKAKRPSYSVLDTSRTTNTTGVAIRPWMQALREYVFREYPSEE